jgi:hypothetical protein
MAAFMLARQEHWYYFGSAGWWDADYAWDALYDKVSTCGKPTQPVPVVGAGPVYTRAFEHLGFPTARCLWTVPTPQLARATSSSSSREEEREGGRRRLTFLLPCDN